PTTDRTRRESGRPDPTDYAPTLRFSWLTPYPAHNGRRGLGARCPCRRLHAPNRPLHEITQERNLVAVVAERLGALNRHVPGHPGRLLVARLTLHRRLDFFQTERMRGHPVDGDPDAVDIA